MDQICIVDCCGTQFKSLRRTISKSPVLAKMLEENDSIFLDIQADTFSVILNFLQLDVVPTGKSRYEIALLRAAGLQLDMDDFVKKCVALKQDDLVRVEALNLAKQTLSGLSIYGARKKSSFNDCVFAEALLNSNLSFSTFINCSLDKVRSKSSLLENVKLIGCTLRNMMIEDTKFFGTWFANADLSHSVFSFSNLSNCVFQGANLSNCVFTDCGFGGANFADAQLDGTTFHGSSFPDVDLFVKDKSGVELWRRLVCEKSNQKLKALDLRKALDLTQEMVGSVDLDSAKLPPHLQDELKGLKFFKYESNFDENGIMFHLGKGKGNGVFVEPCEDPSLVICSQISSNDGLGKFAFARDYHLEKSNYCGFPNSWFSIVFQTVEISPTAYTLKHGSRFNANMVRNWKLQGLPAHNYKDTDDPKDDLWVHWVDLVVHNNDKGIHGETLSATWEIPMSNEMFYRGFRLLSTGSNSDGHDHFMVGGWEIYGQTRAL